MLNSAVVAAAMKHPLVPSDDKMEKMVVPNTPCSIETRHKEPKPHQARTREPDSADPDFFIEIFAGTAGLSTRVKALGQIIYTFDTKTGRSGDILNKDTYELIKDLIRSKHCIGVWFGMPCGTLS